MLYDYQPGNTPLLVNVPHAGIELPQQLTSRLAEGSQALPDTDWHVNRIAKAAVMPGVSLLCARYSRYVIDLNRGSDDKPLYAGATTGLVPTKNFDGSPVYSDNTPDEEEVDQRIEAYWRPYHDRLFSELEALRRRHGFAVLLDLHSIRSSIPRLFEGRLPDLNLGTFEERSCASELQQQAADLLAGTDEFSSVINGRFKGGFITRHYGRPDKGVHALQLEIAQACYMDESRPRDFDPAVAQPLIALLEQLIGKLSQWRPI